MVFAAHTGPLGSSVHFWEYSASQDGCIRGEHILLVPRTPSTDYLDRQTDLVETNRHVSRHTEPQNYVELRDTTRPQRRRQGLRC